MSLPSAHGFDRRQWLTINEDEKELDVNNKLFVSKKPSSFF